MSATGNETLVEMAGVDGAFDPRDPATFHFESVRRVVMEELGANDDTGHIACYLTCARILKARGDTVSPFSGDDRISPFRVRPSRFLASSFGAVLRAVSGLSTAHRFGDSAVLGVRPYMAVGR